MGNCKAQTTLTQHRYGEGKRQDVQEIEIMAAGREGGRTRHKGSTEPGKRELAGRVAEEDAKLGRGATVVDIDPGGAFFESFWEQVEGDADDGRGGAPVSG